MAAMKRFIVIITATVLYGFNHIALAQVDAGLVENFVKQAQSSGDSQLGSIASELTGKVNSLGKLLGGNTSAQSGLNDTLKSLTGGSDSAALTSAFNLVKSAQLTPQQLDLAKQVGNLASAYVVQKNFASLAGGQDDVGTIVSLLREGKVTAAIPAIKNVAGNTHLTDGQKQLITTVADKYAPGWEKAKGAMDSLKKLPGF